MALEKAMAPHSNTLAWKIPWTEEPGGLQSKESRRVGHDWATSFSLFIFILWRRKWQLTPVFLAWRIPGARSLMGCCLWGHTESDTTEAVAVAEMMTSNIISLPNQMSSTSSTFLLKLSDLRYFSIHYTKGFINSFYDEIMSKLNVLKIFDFSMKNFSNIYTN